MKTTTARSVPQANGRDGYDWISPQDVVRHALAAYYYCCRDSDAYPVDPSDPEDVASRLQHSRREFAVFLGERFAERVYQSGVTGGVPSFPRRPSENTPGVLSGPGFPIIGDTPDIHCALSKP